MTAYSFPPTILREYDIRGTTGKTLDDAVAYHVGRGFAAVLKEDGKVRPKVAMGRDGRVSSPGLAAALARGLTEGGADVLDVGLGPTPMLYFAVHHLGADGGIMVTGSHNPPPDNGFKMMRGKSSFFGEEIQALGRRVAEGRLSTGEGTVAAHEIREAYVARLLQDYASPRPLKVVWDNGNGAAGAVLPQLLAKLPGTHQVLFGDVDGRFPNHHPDPTVEKNLVDLKAAVAASKADLGIAFDGDADRIGVVDETGGVIWGDQLIGLLAREVLAERPGSTIIADVKASQVLYDEIARLGGRPLMWKTGHSLIKTKMKEEKAPLAGEMSGHIFYADRFYGHDDAIYVGIRLLGVLGKLMQDGTLKSLSAYRRGLPKVESTPELRIDCPEERKFKAVEEVRARLAATGAQVSAIDGVRVSTEDGWWLLRASNTQPVLVARAEARDAAGLARLKTTIRETLAGIGVAPPLAL